MATGYYIIKVVVVVCLIDDGDEAEVYLHPMPMRVKGFVTKDAESKYIVIINENLSEAKRIEVLYHELKHVRLGHLFSEEMVYSIERSCQG